MPHLIQRGYETEHCVVIQAKTPASNTLLVRMQRRLYNQCAGPSSRPLVATKTGYTRSLDARFFWPFEGHLLVQINIQDAPHLRKRHLRLLYIIHTSIAGRGRDTTWVIENRQACALSSHTQQHRLPLYALLETVRFSLSFSFLLHLS